MPTRIRTALTLCLAAILALTLIPPAAAHSPRGHSPSRAFPDLIHLPDGWQPEGIAAGRGTTVYAGSLATGAVWKADVRTGKGRVLVPPHPGRIAAGLKYSQGVLFVAGASTGQAYLYDAGSGADVKVLQLAAGTPTFINDVTVTRRAAWFTDSQQPVLYRVPLWHGRVYGPVRTVPLTGDWQQVDGFNANGIAATPDGRTLLVVNSTVGALYRVDPASGRATVVATDEDLTAGDGILLRGHTLAVVRNQLEQVVLLRMSEHFSSATLQRRLTNPAFDVPTTIAAVGHRLYVVNARFTTPPGPDVTYDIVKVR